MERKNHFTLPTSQALLEPTDREYISAIRDSYKLKTHSKMQPSPNSPLTLPKQEEGLSGPYDGVVDEGRLIGDIKSDITEKSSFSGEKFNFWLYAANCIYNCHDLKVIDLS